MNQDKQILNNQERIAEKLKHRKKKLENQILQKINDFEKETGFLVRACGIERTTYSLNGEIQTNEITDLQIEVIYD